MKKVLCLIDRLGFGGAERQMIGLSVLLKQKGYVVDLATYYDFDFNTDILESAGVRLLKLKQHSFFLAKLMMVRRLVNKEKYDVVIAYKTGATMLACILKMMGGGFKLIVSERNTTQTFTQRDKLRFWLYKKADDVVPNSYTQEDLIKGRYPALASKTTTITNFTDTDHFCPSEANHSHPMVVLTTARIAKQKNVLNYLDAVKKVKDEGADIQFRWFGNVQEGQEDYGKECVEKVEKLGLADVFEFHPATSNIVEEYQKCDFFCLPSFYEGYPNVVCEAMSCGKPVVCSRVCDNPHIVEDGKNGLMFNPLDANDMAKAILEMSRLSEKQRQDMGVRSREIAVNNFSMEAFVDKYIKMIEGYSFV